MISQSCYYNAHGTCPLIDCKCVCHDLKVTPASIGLMMVVTDEQIAALRCEGHPVEVSLVYNDKPRTISYDDLIAFLLGKPSE